MNVHELSVEHVRYEASVYADNTQFSHGTTTLGWTPDPTQGTYFAATLLSVMTSGRTFHGQLILLPGNRLKSN